MQIGSNVVWTTSEGKTFGNLWKNEGGRYTILTAEGQMSFPHGDGTVELDDSGLHDYQHKAIEMIANSNAVVSAPSKREGKTKFEQCQELYNSTEFLNVSRGNIIRAFVSRLGMTPAGAATYYYKCTRS